MHGKKYKWSKISGSLLNGESCVSFAFAFSQGQRSAWLHFIGPVFLDQQQGNYNLFHIAQFVSCCMLMGSHTGQPDQQGFHCALLLNSLGLRVYTWEGRWFSSWVMVFNMKLLCECGCFGRDILLHSLRSSLKRL